MGGIQGREWVGYKVESGSDEEAGLKCSECNINRHQ